jgi:hypothetical protein
MVGDFIVGWMDIYACFGTFFYVGQSCSESFVHLGFSFLLLFVILFCLVTLSLALLHYFTPSPLFSSLFSSYPLFSCTSPLHALSLPSPSL